MATVPLQAQGRSDITIGKITEVHIERIESNSFQVNGTVKTTDNGPALILTHIHATLHRKGRPIAEGHIERIEILPGQQNTEITATVNLSCGASYLDVMAAALLRCLDAYTVDIRCDLPDGRGEARHVDFTGIRWSDFKHEKTQ